MIEFITLRNFQLHKKRHIEFDRHVTCIIGESDKGKSSVLRAFYWLCFNRPAGDDMVRHGRRKAIVHVGVDGHIISRERGAAANRYRFSGKNYVSFGQTVPEEIAGLLNVAEINFQNQLDPPFWLADPAPKVSRELNAVVNLSVIDDTLAASASQVRQAKAELEVCETRLTRAREELNNLSWVPAMLKEVAALEKLDQQVTHSRARTLALRSRLDRAGEIEQTRWRASGAKVDGVALNGLGERYFAGLGRLERLGSLMEEARRLQAITDVETVDVSTVNPLYNKVANDRQRLTKLYSLIESARKEEAALWQSRSSTIRAEGELAEQKQCPVCGSRLIAGR